MITREEDPLEDHVRMQTLSERVLQRYMIIEFPLKIQQLGSGPVSHASSRLVVVLSNYSEILDKSSITKTDKKLINVYAYIL